jgi:hypothetical protein
LWECTILYGMTEKAWSRAHKCVLQACTHTWSEYRCAPLETVAVFSGCVCTVWSFFVVFGPTKRLCRAVDSVRKKAHTHTLSLPLSLALTQYSIHCKENSKYVFSEIKLRGLVPNFHIYTSVTDLYILRIYPPVLLQPNRQTNHGNICINRPQIYECRNWDWGRAVSFMGIFFPIFGACARNTNY